MPAVSCSVGGAAVAVLLWGTNLFVPKPRGWSDPPLQSQVDVLTGSGRVPVNPSRCAAVVTHTPLTAVCLSLVLDQDLRVCAVSGLQ
jgi:hypothetical protein